MLKKYRSLFKFCSTPKQNPFFTDIQVNQLIQKPNQLRKIFLQQIDQIGQVKMDHYWRQALTHPTLGYYSTQNVFSKDGDFITSPQISSLFGQMIGIWVITFLRSIKVYDQSNKCLKKRIRIVQLGGGRGFLIRQVVKVFSDLGIKNGFDISMIQVSQYNRKAQQQGIMEAFKKNDHFFKFQHQQSNKQMQKFTSQNQDKDIKLHWFSSIQTLYNNDVQNQKNGIQTPLTIFLMNQFFDALPTTILQYTQQGWKQKIFTKSIHNNTQLQLKPSNNKLPQKLTPLADDPQIGDQIQVSYQSMITMDNLAKMIQKYGGAIFNCDYGDDGYFADSIRAIKSHKFVPKPQFWQIPGQCDLSSYVNFAILGDFAQNNQNVVSYPLTTQGQFLKDMGIQQRLDSLRKKVSNQQVKRLQGQVQRLVNEEQMGQIYKVQIISLKQYGPIYPYVVQSTNVY